MRAGLESQVKRAADEAARAKAEQAQAGHNKSKDAFAGGTTGTTAGARFNQVARDMEEIVERGYVVVGSPKDVAEQLEHVAKTLNVGHFMMLLQYGNMSKELTKYNTRLFAEKVMPKLQPLFSEWEHKWWPKPMQGATRAELPAFQPRVAAE